VPGVLLFVVLAAALVYAVAGGAPETGPARAGSFGVQAFSAAFLNEYWLYFELISLLLVAAVVAAIAVVRIGGPRRG
jgi:NADH:ubiquinone oxidoreductase subunit 6 (subunit J)